MQPELRNVRYMQNMEGEKSEKSRKESSCIQAGSDIQNSRYTYSDILDVATCENNFTHDVEHCITRLRFHMGPKENNFNYYHMGSKNSLVILSTLPKIINKRN